MNYIRHLNAFFSFIRSDNRLTSSHVSLYLALFQYWNFNRFQNPFPIYRENIMQISKIGSKNTYHKCIKELHEARYICYQPSRTKFQAVKISMIRLDIKEEKHHYQQLDLFNQNTSNEKAKNQIASHSSPSGGGKEGASPKSGTGSVPNLTNTSTDIDTGTVPDSGHLIKQNSKKENSVFNTPTKIFEKNLEINQKLNDLLHNNDQYAASSPPFGGTQTGGVARFHRVSKSVHKELKPPDLELIETFFRENNYPLEEARKFYYYNQGKNWMLTDKIPIQDWQALAHKWILNTKPSNKTDVEMNIEKAIQFVYDVYLKGISINGMLQPEFADHLKLEITDKILAEARQRRINQLSGSNERSENQLWNAYMNEDFNNDIIVKDQANLLSLAKRLAVLKHFQKLKSKGATNVIN